MVLFVANPTSPVSPPRPVRQRSLNERRLMRLRNFSERDNLRDMAMGDFAGVQRYVESHPEMLHALLWRRAAVDAAQLLRYDVMKMILERVDFGDAKFRENILLATVENMAYLSAVLNENDRRDVCEHFLQAELSEALIQAVHAQAEGVSSSLIRRGARSDWKRNARAETAIDVAIGLGRVTCLRLLFHWEVGLSEDRAVVVKALDDARRAGHSREIIDFLENL